MPRIRAFLATSLDGYIAGPDDALDWLPGPDTSVEDTFSPFLGQIGAMLMGRRTFDVVDGFPGEWPYGDLPILVATNRDLATSRPTVRRVTGPIAAMVDAARQAAGDRDVYLDGGALFRSAFDADRVDELTVTVVPVVLGGGVPLWGTAGTKRLTLESSRTIGGGLVQSRYRCR
jgi:dihydrofolate reductase